MKLIRLSFPVLICILMLTDDSAAQDTDLPVNKWLSILSTANEDDLMLVDSVYTMLIKYDAAEICTGLNMLEEKIPQKKTRLKIRLIMVKASLFFGNYQCNAPLLTTDLAKKAFHLSYELEDETLIARICLLNARYYTTLYDHGNTILYSRIADEISKKIGKQGLVDPHDLYNYGFALYYSQDYTESIQANKRALGWNAAEFDMENSRLDVYYSMHSLNTTGLAFHKSQQFDSAIYCFDQAISLCTDSFWIALLKGNIGDVYYDLGQLDTAATLLNIDVGASIYRGIWDNAANSLQWLARIHLMNGKTSLSLSNLRQAMKYLNLQPNEKFLENTLFAFAETYRKLGDADSVSHYMKQYQVIHDRLEKKGADNRAEIIQMRLDNTIGVQKILTLNKDKKRISLIRNFSIALILLASALGYIYLNRQRLKLQLKQKETLAAKQKAETEAKNAIAQLNLFTESLREKTSLIENLQKKLVNKELNEEQTSLIHELTQQTILTDQHWDQFKHLFNKVYPNFFMDLKREVADITLAEQRMAALIKLQIPVKDAANMLGISSNSVHKNRQRLKMRLGLEQDEELEAYILKDHGP